MSTVHPESRLACQRWPRSRPKCPAGAKALAAAKVFHAPLAGRGDSDQPPPGQTPEQCGADLGSFNTEATPPGHDGGATGDTKS